MENRTKIFIGIPCHKPYKEFMESLSCFLAEVSKKYQVCAYSVYGKSLVDAQNEIAEVYVKSGYDYLLMLEDDHWGHTLEMLETLLQHDKLVCGIKYYSRHYPFVVIPMAYKDYFDKHHFEMNIYGSKEDIAESGLVGFGMTLIKRVVFDILARPYFRLNTDEQGNVQKGYATDQDFCNRVRQTGNKIFGCFNHCLTHRGLDDHTVLIERDKAMGEKSGIKLQMVGLMKKRRGVE